jgi:DNA-directed RNA polymerase specialized sigma24 family protein
MAYRLRSLLKRATSKDFHSLLQGCIKHDRECQRLLYTKYYGFALKVIYRYVGEYSTAVRMTNESFLEVFHSLSGFRIQERSFSESSFNDWIKNMLIQSVVMWSHSQDWDGVTVATLTHSDAAICLSTAGEDMPDAQLWWILMTRLLSLPLSHRMIFNLNVIDGYSIAEVTRLCGIRPKVAERYLHEARLTLLETDWAPMLMMIRYD